MSGTTSQTCSTHQKARMFQGVIDDLWGIHINSEGHEEAEFWCKKTVEAAD